MFQDIAQDIRSGIRQLRNAPTFTVAVVLVLALGIGANTAIFSAIDAAFLRPLPFADPERLVTLKGIDLPFALSAGQPQLSPRLGDIVADSAAFVGAAAYATGGLNLVGGAAPMRATVTYITTDFFRTLGRQPFVGRVPVSSEFAQEASKTIVISYGLWQREFGGDRTAIERSVTLNGVPYRVVGVMPRDFRFPAETDLWIPLALPFGFDIMEAFRNFLPAQFVARLAPGVSAAQASQHVDAIRRRYRPAIGADDTPASALASSLQQSLVGDRRTALVVLMTSAAALLLIACANVTNLLLSRAANRERELAVRAVLGATRTRVIRQLLVENLLLSLAGGAAALVVARVSLTVLTAALPASLAGVAPPEIDARVLVFALILATFTSFGFGLWPAMAASRPDLTGAIKSGSGIGGTGRRTRVRGMLIVAEVSLALMLLIGAGLMIQSLRTLLRVDTGMQAQHVVTGRLVLSQARYGRNAKAEFLSRITSRLNATPGVEGAAAVSALPMEAAAGISLRVVPEDAPDDPNRTAGGAYLMATPGYFRVMGVALDGQDLPSVADTSNPVAVINRTMAAKLWPGQNAIGRRLRMGSNFRRVIGVVADIRNRRLDAPPAAQMYFPMAESPQSYAAIVARAEGDPRALLSQMEATVHSIDPLQPVYALRTMDEVMSASVAPRRTNTLLLTVFGALALLLAGVGVYGVLSYEVAQRTREIGVRLALGAQRRDVVELVVGDGLVPAGVGIVLGLAGAYALSRLLSAILYEVSPHDVRVFVVAPLVLFGIALFAVLLPAVRATRVDPMLAMRAE
jgi:putative ABC transport system permease protein